MYKIFNMDFKKTLIPALILAGSFNLIGCANTSNKNPKPTTITKKPIANSKADTVISADDPTTVNVDPYEKINRGIYKFNDALDTFILRPIASGYDFITPTPIRKGVNNFFDNVDMLTTIPNDILQGKSAYFVADTWRFILNTTVGIGGLFDIATLAGLPKHHEDFGLTLAYWGGQNGLKPQPFLMLPFLGPSTTRDAFGKIANGAAWPFNYMRPIYYNYIAVGVNVVRERADLLAADKLVHDAFDPYIFVRSAYLQNRNHQIEKNRHETNFPPYTDEATSDETLSPEEDNIGNEL